MAHLWTSGPKPAEYLRYQVTQLYHCTPAEARQIAARDVADDLSCLAAERLLSKGAS